MTQLERKFVFIYALFAMPISGVSVDLYVPSLPDITHYFSTTQSLVQLSIGLFLLGYGVFS